MRNSAKLPEFRTFSGWTRISVWVLNIEITWKNGNNPNYSENKISFWGSQILILSKWIFFPGAFTIIWISAPVFNKTMLRVTSSMIDVLDFFIILKYSGFPSAIYSVSFMRTFSEFSMGLFRNLFLYFSLKISSKLLWEFFRHILW